MPADARSYFEQLCRDAGMDESTTAALTAAASNEKLSGKMNELVRRATDDFSAMQGRVNALDTKVKNYDAWYTDANAEYARAVDELNALKSKPAGSDFDTSQFLTKKDWEAQQREMMNRTAQVVKQVGRLASRHASRYGEELDVDAIEKIANEQGVDVATAYDRFVAPRELERSTKEVEARVKAAREEGAREAMSRQNFPVDINPSEHSIIRHKAAPLDAGRSINEELSAAWDSARK